ncbi:unnamed protein product [Dicrocoelium dendriticum]|nr:unnamed protein product [Dicrocoelium dendriticum]
MPATADQLLRIYAIQKMKEHTIPLPPHLTTLSFDEQYLVFKSDQKKFTFPMSYPHWIQSEKLRHYNPTVYDTWLQSCTTTKYFQPVPPINLPSTSRKRQASPEPQPEPK